MKIKNPFFIVFEGIDGSGKTTQIKNLYEKLKQNNIPVYLTTEPTNGYIGSVIRDIFSGKKKADEHTIVALFLADRLEHILNSEDGLLRYLKSNISILCDRYYFSSYAYHSIHVNQNWIIECNNKCKEFLKPDLTIFFDITVEESLARIQKRSKNNDFYEIEDTLKKVQENYFKFFKLRQNEENIIFINANQNKKKVFLDLWKEFKKRISFF